MFANPCLTTFPPVAPARQTVSIAVEYLNLSKNFNMKFSDNIDFG